MAERFPSLEIIAARVRTERDVLFRHAEAVDARAGVSVGFAAALAGIAVASFDWWRVPGILLAIGSALECLAVLLPRRYPAWNLERLRDIYLRSEERFTRLMLLDTEIRMVEQHSAVVRRNARHLRRAVLSLFAAAVALTIGTVVSSAGG